MKRPLLEVRPFIVLISLSLGPAFAQDPPKLKIATSDNDEIARYCAALGPSVVEARAAYQLRRLDELEAQARDEVEKLEVKERAARAWVTRREAMMKSATEDVVAIYAKMAPEAAAAEIAAMEEVMAAAVLAKLKPGVAGAILAEMQADKAAKLSMLIAGALAADKS